jgi:hypothetical protein
VTQHEFCEWPSSRFQVSARRAGSSRYFRADLPDGRGADSPVQPLLQKYFPFTFDPNHMLIHRCPVPPEGRLAIVTDAGRDAVDVEVPITNGAEADGEVVWS